MLYVFTGTDFDAIQHKANGLVAGLQQKQPDADLVTVGNRGDNEHLIDNLLSLANDQGLFFQKSLVKIARLLPDTKIEKDLKKIVAGLQESPSIFIWTEPELNKTWVNLLKKHKVTLDVTGEAQTGNQKFNVFSLTDALLQKNRKKLWQLLHEARDNGVEAENIFGTVWWQVKTLVVSLSNSDASSAGVKPFSYNKAIRSAWQIDEARDLLHELAMLQSRAKSAGNSFGLWYELEDWALRL